MKRQYRWLIGAGAVILVAAIVVQNLRANREPTVLVELQPVVRKNLVATISAPGRIQPKRLVDVSANTMGKIVSLGVREGDRVKRGDFLIAIDPTPYETAAAAAAAQLAASQANLKLARARAGEAEQERERQKELRARGFATDREVVAAQTAWEVAAAQVEAGEKGVDQARSNLENARHELTKVRIVSEIDGVITRLNVEEGENAITGTMNNPGTVLLTIADLSVLEAEVRVDETDVVNVAVGQPARVEIDAFPDTSFAGTVTEVGNSPILSGDMSTEQAADFKVVVTLTDPVPEARPGLSANAEIRAASRDSALAVPIQAVTLRTLPEGTAGADSASAPRDTTGGKGADEAEGVFVVSDGHARFRVVRTGIAGETDFEVLSGLAAGDSVVTGDFEALRKLEDGDRVRTKKTREADGSRGRRAGKTKQAS